MEKFHVPSLHLRAARGRLDQPATGGRVGGDISRFIAAHEDPHAAPALGGKLQPARFDSRKLIDAGHHCAEARASQTFSQRPHLLRSSRTSQQHEPAKIDSSGSHRRQVQFAIRIAPGNRPAVLLRRPRQQQRKRERKAGRLAPQQLMHGPALKLAMRSQFIQGLDARAKPAPAGHRRRLGFHQPAQRGSGVWKMSRQSLHGVRVLVLRIPRQSPADRICSMRVKRSAKMLAG